MTLYQQYTASQKAVEKAPVGMFLTGNLIKITVGDFLGHNDSVREVYTLPVEGGALMDGRIVDEEAFAAQVSAFLNACHLQSCPVYLTVDSADFVCRVLNLPKQRGMRVREYIHRYFGMAERIQKPVYSYIPLEDVEGKQETRYLVAAVSTDTLGQLERVFKLMNVRLVSVEASLLCAVRVLSRLPEVQGKTCVVQIMDGREATGLMFVQGVYRASVRSHLWEPFGSIGFGVEFARLNEQILQNMRKEYPDNTPEAIFLCGIRGENLAVTTEAIRHLGNELPLSSPAGEGYVYADHHTEDYPSLFSEYLVPISAVRYNTEEQNLLALRSVGLKKSLPVRYRVAVAAFAAVFVVLAVMIAAKAVQLNRLTAEHEQLQAEVAVLEQDANRYTDTLYRLGEYRSRTTAIDALNRAIASYPYPNSALNAIIRACSSFTDAEGNEIKVADVKIESYNAEAGKLQFTVRAPADQVLNYYRFPEELRKIGVFKTVSYEGFEQDGDSCRILVDCVLDERAGKN